MNAAPSGITTRKIIVMPCMVNTWLYCAAFSTVPLACTSCRRMSSASTPPITKKNSAVMP